MLHRYTCIYAYVVYAFSLASLSVFLVVFFIISVIIFSNMIVYATQKEKRKEKNNTIDDSKRNCMSNSTINHPCNVLLTIPYDKTTRSNLAKMLAIRNSVESLHRDLQLMLSKHNWDSPLSRPRFSIFRCFVTYR